MCDRKRLSQKGEITRSSKVVYNIKLPFAFSKFAMHLQSTKVEVLHGVPFLSYVCAPK